MTVVSLDTKFDEIYFAKLSKGAFVKRRFKEAFTQYYCGYVLKITFL